LKNDDPGYATEYHEATKHSELSLQMSAHYLDWDNKPRAFKVYTNLLSIPLPRDIPRPGQGALKCVGQLGPFNEGKTFDIARLAEILFFSAGITRELKHPSGRYFMRAASATGALYPIELYVVSSDIPGLSAGVYHFGPGDFALTELRSGDYRKLIGNAAGGASSVLTSPVTIVFTSMAWRNSWKYQARSYRHWFWDSGVIIANLLATTISEGLVTRLLLGFEDRVVDHLLGLKEREEATVALIPIGMGQAEPPRSSPEVTSIKPVVLSLSKAQVEYPEIWKINEGSSLKSGQEAKAWVDSAASFKPRQVSGDGSVFPIKSLTEPTPRKLWEVIIQRGSTRRFAKLPISFTDLSAIIFYSTRSIPADFLREKRSLIETYFIANAVEGLPSGAFYFNRQDNALRLLKAGELRTISGYLCLGQHLFSQASVVFFLMADLDAVFQSFGNRGYRAAQLEAGIIAGKLYLSAYSLGLGASGSTFFDDAVTEFFSPHALTMSNMIAVGVGKPDYMARPGKIMTARLTREQLLTDQF